jgi:hypothetical protein
MVKIMVPGKDDDIHPSMSASQPYPLTDTLTDKFQNYFGIAIIVLFINFTTIHKID